MTQPSSLPPGRLYLGRAYDPATKEQGEPYHMKPSDLTTHGLIVGMTGSGKTGLSVGVVEECLRNRIPVLIIDPKGDMTNLALAFDRLAPDQFQQWIDPVSAAQKNTTVEAAAASTAELWTNGLASYGIQPSDVAAYAASVGVRIVTPGSNAGIPLNLVGHFDPPAEASDPETFRDHVDASVTALLGLLGIDPDPVKSREYILLSALIDDAWRTGQQLSLEALIGLVAQPPMTKLGALPLDVVYPPGDRNKLMFALNNLLASPAFAAWREGEAIDFDRWFAPVDGRTPATVVYTAHLDDNERPFVTALLLDRFVDWVRNQPGTGELRCLLYMDEIFGYFPPTANPPTKKPLLTLLKQARAYGVGVLLATQNPVDLDYKGLSNMGFWAIGRLQTTQDQARVKQGIESAIADAGLSQSFDDLIGGVQQRVFLIHNIHRPRPELVHSRWVMSYLRGPITREELPNLPVIREATSSPASTPPTGGSSESSPAPAPAQQATGTTVMPLPSPWRGRYLSRRAEPVAAPHLYVHANVRYKLGRSDEFREARHLAIPLTGANSWADVLEQDWLETFEGELAGEPATPIERAEPPGFVFSDGPKGAERALKSRLDDRLAVDVYYDASTKLWGRPHEAVDDFADRVRLSPANAEKRRRLQQQLADKRNTLSIRREEARGRKFEKFTHIGAALLDGLTGRGRRRSARTIASSMATKSRMEGNAQSRVDQLEHDVFELEENLRALDDIDLLRFEVKTVKPAQADVSIVEHDIAWVS